MLRSGDEFLNTQGGNNNPYNQDNETSWLDWDLLGKNEGVFRFFKLMIAFRKARTPRSRGAASGARMSRGMAQTVPQTLLQTLGVWLSTSAVLRKVIRTCT